MKRANTIPENPRPAHPAVGVATDLRPGLPGRQTNWRLLEARQDIRTVQALLGHAQVETTINGIRKDAATGREYGWRV